MSQSTVLTTEEEASVEYVAIDSEASVHAGQEDTSHDPIPKSELPLNADAACVFMCGDY